MEGSAGSLHHHRLKDDSDFGCLLEQELALLTARQRAIAAELRSKDEQRKRALRSSAQFNCGTDGGVSKQIGPFGPVKTSGQLRPILARRDQHQRIVQDNSHIVGVKSNFLQDQDRTGAQKWKESGVLHHQYVPGDFQNASHLQKDQFSTQSQRTAERSDVSAQSRLPLYQNLLQAGSLRRDTDRLPTVCSAPTQQQRLDRQMDWELQRQLASHEAQQRLIQTHNQSLLARRFTPEPDSDLQRRIDAFRELDQQQRSLSAQREKELAQRIDALHQRKLQQLVNYQLMDQKMQSRVTADLNRQQSRLEQTAFQSSQGSDYLELTEPHRPGRASGVQELDQLLRDAQRDSLLEQRSRLLNREQELERFLAMNRHSALLQPQFGVPREASTERGEASARDERFGRDAADLERLSLASRRSEYSQLEAERLLLARDEIERRLSSQLGLASDQLRPLEPSSSRVRAWRMRELAEATVGSPTSSDRELDSDEMLAGHVAEAARRRSPRNSQSGSQDRFGGRQDGQHRRIRRESGDRRRHHVRLGVPSQRHRSQRSKSTDSHIGGSIRLLTTSNLDPSSLGRPLNELATEDGLDDARSSGSRHSFRNAMEVDVDFTSSSDDDAAGGEGGEAEAQRRPDARPHDAAKRVEKAAVESQRRSSVKSASQGKSSGSTRDSEKRAQSDGATVQDPEKLPAVTAAQASSPGSSELTDNETMISTARHLPGDDMDGQSLSGGGAAGRRRSSTRSEQRPEPDKSTKSERSDRALARERSLARRASLKSDDEDDDDAAGGKGGAEARRNEERKQRRRSDAGKRRTGGRKPSNLDESVGPPAITRRSKKVDSTSSEEEEDDDTPKAVATDSAETPEAKHLSRRSSRNSTGSQRRGSSGGGNADSRFYDATAGRISARSEPSEKQSATTRRPAVAETPEEDEGKDKVGELHKPGARDSGAARPSLGWLNSSRRFSDSRRVEAVARDLEHSGGHRTSGHSRHNKSAPDSNTQDSEQRTGQNEETRDTDSDTEMRAQQQEQQPAPQTGGKVQLLDRSYMMSFMDARKKVAAQEAQLQADGATKASADRPRPHPVESDSSYAAAATPAVASAKEGSGRSDISAKKALAKTVSRVPAAQGAAIQVKPEDTLTQEDIEACKARAAEKSEQRRKRKEGAVVAGTTDGGSGPAPLDDASSDSEADEDVAPVMQTEESRGPEIQPQMEVERQEPDPAPVAAPPPARRQSARRSVQVARPISGDEQDVMALEQQRQPKRQPDLDQQLALENQQPPRRRKPRTRAAAAVAPRAPPTARRERQPSLPDVMAIAPAPAPAPPPAVCYAVCQPCQPCRQPPRVNCCCSCGVASCYPVSGSINYCCPACRMC